MVASADGVVMDQFRGYGVQSRAFGLLTQWAQAGELPDEVTAELLRELPRLEPSRDSLKRACRIEYCHVELGGLHRLSSLPVPELIDTIMAQDLAVPTNPQTRGLLGIQDDDIRKFQRGWSIILRDHPRPLDMIETVKLGSSILFQLLGELDRPFATRRRNFVTEVAKPIEAWPRYLRLNDTPISFLFGNKELKPPTDAELEAARGALAKVPNVVGRLMVSSIAAYEMIFRAIEFHRANARAAWIILACRRKLDRDETLPERLEELIQGKWIDSLPLDPFSERPFGYSRDRGLLWSVGDDGQDNEGDWDFETDPPQGKDLVWKLPLAPRRRG
jgi:hypothetical protein